MMMPRKTSAYLKFRTRGIAKQRGQGMAEALIAATFVLIPLAIGLPYLAKVADTRHKLHQAARYAAWERTVYHRNGANYNVKSDDAVMREINRRVLARADQVIDSNRDRQSVALNTIPLDVMLATPNYRQGGQLRPFLNPVQQTTNSYVRLTVTERPEEGRLAQIVNRVRSFGLDLDPSVIQTHRVTADLYKLPMLAQAAGPFEVSAQNALLLGSWNARGPDNVRERIRNTVPTTFLNNGFLNSLQNIIGIIGFDEIRANSLQWGRIDPDRVPCQRLAPPGGVSAC